MKNEVIKDLVSWVLHVLVGLVFALLMVTFVFRFTIVRGVSMDNTLKNSQVLYTDKLTYRFSSPKRGDIVICKYPGDDENCIKRIIALPGESVYFKDGEVYINGVAGVDKWGDGHVMDDMNTVEVPQGCYFVLGDNRSKSKDSREVGCIPESEIYGKAIFTIFPLNSFGKIKYKA